MFTGGLPQTRGCFRSRMWTDLLNFHGNNVYKRKLRLGEVE